MRWVLSLWLLFVTGAAAAADGSPAASVRLTLHSGAPQVRLTLMRALPKSSAKHDEVVKECDGDCVVTVPRGGNYWLKTVGLPETDLDYFRDERWIDLDQDQDIRLVAPISAARRTGLVAGVGGSALTVGAGVFIALVAVPRLLGGVRAFWDRHPVATVAVSTAVIALSLPTAICGWRVFSGNSSPRLTVTPRTPQAPTRQAFLAPARLGDGWGLVGAAAF